MVAALDAHLRAVFSATVTDVDSAQCADNRIAVGAHSVGLRGVSADGLALGGIGPVFTPRHGRGEFAGIGVEDAR